jgi:iron complex transport system substrate-binding protein
VTEIVFALGLGERVVGTDTSSTYPAAAAQLPKAGYQRTLAAEGVLSLRPSLILATTEAGPPAAIAQLKGSGVPLILLPGEPTPEAAKARIRGIARTLGREKQGDALVQALRRDLDTARTALQRPQTRPKALFLYARGNNTLLVAGQGNAADTMIRLAGATNAISGYEGYKPLTAEAAVAAAPEVILVPKAGLASIGGSEGLWQLPGLALTPAGRSHRVVAMDDLYLLGFGPRLGRAVRELGERLHALPSTPRASR